MRKGFEVQRFLVGLVLGVIAGGVTYVVTPVPPWWWAVGLTVAVLVWVGEWVLAGIAD